MLGSVVGGYRITAKLGEGGMGVVYAAEHEIMGRQAAVKILRSDAVTAEAVRRFLNEARAAASIQHPGIISVFDFGHDAEGHPFLIMERLEGETLGQRIRRASLEEAEAWRIASQISDALVAAHDRGIVHRDLKPENVFLVPDAALTGGARAKIVDFGVAKLMNMDLGAAVTRTQTGVFMGSPAYASPEQIKGEPTVDGRTDQYALGCIMFEMLARRRPFLGDSIIEVMANHLNQAPPLGLLERARASARYREVVARALSKSPGARFASMRELAATLAAGVEHRAAATPARATARAPQPSAFEPTLASTPRAPTPASRPQAIEPTLAGDAWAQAHPELAELEARLRAARAPGLNRAEDHLTLSEAAGGGAAGVSAWWGQETRLRYDRTARVFLVWSRAYAGDTDHGEREVTAAAVLDDVDEWLQQKRWFLAQL